MPWNYAATVMTVLIALFALSVIMPKYVDPWWKRRLKARRERKKRDHYKMLREEICLFATAENRANYYEAIIQFNNRYTPGCAGEYRLLIEFLEEAVVSAVDVDFKKELGI